MNLILVYTIKTGNTIYKITIETCYKYGRTKVAQTLSQMNKLTK